MNPPIDCLRVPLPDDIARLKAAGYYDQCRAAIKRRMSQPDLPDLLLRRLEVEWHRLPFYREEEWPYTDEAALALLEDTFTQVRPDELERLIEEKAADWLYFRGRRRFHRRLVENLLNSHPDYIARQRKPAPPDTARLEKLRENIAIMKGRGARAARLTLRHTFQVKPQAVEPGQLLRVQLPLPRACALQSDIEVLELSHPGQAQVGRETDDQRLVTFRDVAPEETCRVTYRYVNRLRYVDPRGVSPETRLSPSFHRYLRDQPPHIRFTPLMEHLHLALYSVAQSPLERARAVYDYVTTHIRYSYMPEYATLDCACDYAVLNGKGDCGIQALLFITLCRMAGVPARWQSGFAAGPDKVGCHDWAEFYVEPYGWLYADCSYGGSAYRAGDLERWNYYFGNLDIYRMAANGDVKGPFGQERGYFPADPVDSQRGEAEHALGPIYPWQFDWKAELLELEEL